MTDPASLTIAEAARAIQRRELSPTELTRACLERIERLNPRLNAFVLVTAERAQADAARAEEELQAGIYRGPLHGIPVGLKDLYDTAGIETAAGSAVLRGRIPERDAAAAAMLREAGAVLLGKTNTHEFAWGTTTNNPHTGPTRNPWDPERIPGGSSGGSGAAIAARLALGTLGTDTGGSIRIPAALCGCVGLKPTFGRVSRAGIIPMSWQFDHAGPIARTVEDAALLLRAIAGYDPDDFATVPVPVPDYRAALVPDVRGLRIGVPRDQFFGLLDPEVLVAVEEALETFRSLGAVVEDVDSGFTREQVISAWRLVNVEGRLYHAPYLEQHPEAYSEELRNILLQPLPEPLDLATAYLDSYRIKEGVRRVLQSVDLLAAPTTMRPASRIGEDPVEVEGVQLSTGAAFASLTMPFNLAGVPAISIPCGFSSEGLPIGLQLAARPFDEPTLIRAAFSYECATDWHRREPPL
ncbi:amidase [Tepidiforma thermophila]|uniref:Aspartyl-tRNA(Asn)/glutamyl-tRNA(Gln) amidotransferase subunit A n=1 Tax=Tepidiforma thermophila (strain KCTC 52669 / CGMCC 1.13589 / G233) TaxID=2761530 RepID=A0A2A9HE90_TEPT2|nr:amidase [Tepidiforma thermophila]PFG74324.1 aspartyl-tRNA(Asn)/glutamyl-tRNA(Gln) amidotransferase subunit A [Tepidiforma thermophila]